MTILKLILTASINAMLFFCSCTTKRDNSIGTNTDGREGKANTLDGIYVGLEEMCWTDSTGKKDCYTDPGRPERKWYHLGYLKIKDDSVFLDQNPISIGANSDTLWSASDGAFYYYSGTLQQRDTLLSISLKELFCDYCGVPVIQKPDGTQQVIKREKHFDGRLSGNSIVIAGYPYKRTNEKEALMSEHPKPYLRSE